MDTAINYIPPAPCIGNKITQPEISSAELERRRNQFIYLILEFIEACKLNEIPVNDRKLNDWLLNSLFHLKTIIDDKNPDEKESVFWESIHSIVRNLLCKYETYHLLSSVKYFTYAPGNLKSDILNLINSAINKNLMNNKFSPNDLSELIALAVDKVSEHKNRFKNENTHKVKYIDTDPVILRRFSMHSKYRQEQ